MTRSAHRRSRPLAGLGRMTVLGLRTSWRGPALVAVICIALVVAIAVGVEGLYPTRAQRVEYAATAGASGISNAFNGRGYALDTLGGITGVEVGFMGQILFPILGVVTAIGLTRRQEEAGRTELLTASRVGRPAPLAAAALLLVLTCAVTAAGLTASMAATGLPVVGSAWYAAGVGACVLFFAAVGLLLGELCQQARTAQQLGLGAVSVVYLTRFVIDATGWDAAWASPLGWLPEVRAFDSPRAWPLAAYCLASAVLLAVAAVVAARRDAGAGVIAPRPGPARGSARAAAPWVLALRLERTVTGTCLTLVCLWALLIGSFSQEMTEVISANPSMLAGMGLEHASDLVVQLAAIIMIVGSTGAAVQGAAHLAAEESSGRLGLALSTRLGRSRFWLGWWAATLLSAACVLCLSASVLGVSIWGVADRSVPVASVLEVGWAYLPPVVLIGALQALLVSLDPRWCALGWVPVAWTAVVGFLAEALRLPEWARDLSPAHMVGSLPVDDPDPRVITGQCAAAAALLALSLLVFSRRSLRAG